MIELADTSTAVDAPWLREGLLLMGALLGAIIVLFIAQNPSGPVTVLLVGTAALWAIWKGWQLTRRDPIWLGFVLLLWELLSAYVVIPDKVRPIATYGLSLLFCLPAIPILWRIWKSPKTDFRLYLIYFGWCLVTIFYAAVPKFALAHLMRAVLVFAAITMCSLRTRETGEVQRVIRCLMLACIVVTFATAVAGIVLPHSITWGSILQQTGPNPDDLEEVARFQGHSTTRVGWANLPL